MKKILVAYFSRTGTTKKVALELSERLNADVFEIQLSPDAIPDEKEDIDEMAQRQIERGIFSEIINGLPNIDQYDTIVLGSPTWGQTPSTPAISFLKQIRDFKGEIFGFHTFMGDDGDFDERFISFAKPLQVAGSFKSKEGSFEGLEAFVNRIGF